MEQLACEAPEKAGRPISQWTGREIADELVVRGIVKNISARHAVGKRRSVQTVSMAGRSRSRLKASASSGTGADRWIVRETKSIGVRTPA
jgi:hypothetical protein